MTNKKVMPLNPYRNGTCRTIKAQYYKNGVANLVRDGSFGATGVIEYMEIISCAIRGRSDGNWFENEHRQKLEIGNKSYANSITHVTKDSLIIYIKQMEQQQSQNNIKLPIELQGKKFRIRKLTPRECFRLMGVDDADIDKVQAAGISNSAQYKLTGNSIVVDVLYHIFRKMFIETEQEKIKGQQLTLF